MISKLDVAAAHSKIGNQLVTEGINLINDSGHIYRTKEQFRLKNLPFSVIIDMSAVQNLREFPSIVRNESMKIKDVGLYFGVKNNISKLQRVQKAIEGIEKKVKEYDHLKNCNLYNLDKFKIHLHAPIPGVLGVHFNMGEHNLYKFEYLYEEITAVGQIAEVFVRDQFKFAYTPQGIIYNSILEHKEISEAIRKTS